MAKSNENKPSNSEKKRKKSPERPFPRIILEEALKVGSFIKSLNGGNPWDPKSIADAIGIGAVTNKFYYYTASSRDFGITDGTSRNKSISITDFGRELLYAPNPDNEKAKKIEAFFKIPIFKQVFEHYQGSKLPDMKYLSNTLEKEFGLDPSVHEEFVDLYRQNTRYLSLDIEKAPSFSQNDEAKTKSTIILGEPEGKKSKGLKAFVIMPFSEKNPSRSTGYFNEALNSLIMPAGVDAGFSVETAQRSGSDVIQSTIINELLSADLVIADLSDHNPNVLFELGLRMATDKPVALIKSDDTGRIFDVDNMLRVFEYNSNLWKSSIQEDLPKLTEHIKATWKNRESENTYMRLLKRSTT